MLVTLTAAFFVAGLLSQEDKDLTVPCLTKICCTIGPETRSVAILEQLLLKGMSIARFDFSFGDSKYHQEGLDNLRKAMHKTNTLCAVMLDTIGPEMFVLNRPEAIHLQAGQEVTVTTDRSVQASNSVLVISASSLAGLQPGSAVFVGQYLFTGAENTSAYLTIQSVHGNTALCKCNNTCVLEGLQLTVHIANFVSPNPEPILTPEDIVALRQWGKPNNIDYVSLSFCRCAQDVMDCRAALDRCVRWGRATMMAAFILAHLRCADNRAPCYHPLHPHCAPWPWRPPLIHMLLASSVS